MIKIFLNKPLDASFETPVCFQSPDCYTDATNTPSVTEESFHTTSRPHHSHDSRRRGGIELLLSWLINLTDSN